MGILGAIDFVHRRRGRRRVFVFVQRVNEGYGCWVIFYLVRDNGWFFYDVLVVRFGEIGRSVEGVGERFGLGAAEGGSRESFDDWVDSEFGRAWGDACWVAGDDGVVVREDVNCCRDWAVCE